MSCLTSSVVELSLQQFSQLISSGRLTPYENEVALVYGNMSFVDSGVGQRRQSGGLYTDCGRLPALKTSSYTSYVD
jgi:hypothetical protein